MMHFTLMEVNLTSLLMTQFTPWEGLMFCELTGDPHDASAVQRFFAPSAAAGSLGLNETHLGDYPQ